MPTFGLIGPSYTSQSPNADAERTVNWYVERMESDGAKSRAVLYPRPGSQAFATITGALQVRCLFTINERLFAVTDAQLVEVASDGTVTVRGSVLGDDLLPSMAASATELLVSSGGKAYSLTLETNAFAQVLALDTERIQQIAFSDGYFIALVADSQKFRISDLEDAQSWDELDVAIVSLFSDNILSMIVDHRELWLFGRKETIVYSNTGNPDFPFEPIPGAFIQQGTCVKSPPIAMDNSLFWIGGDQRGRLIAWRAQGYLPARVSTHAIEFAWQGYGTIADAISYTYQDQGHSFWVVCFPTESKTWVYDAATNQWHERSWRNPTTADDLADRSQCHAFCFGKHLVGDWKTGTIFERDISFLTDNGDLIRRPRRSANVSKEMDWLYHSSVQVYLETGLASIPQDATGIAALYLQDSDGVIWAVTIGDDELLHTTSGATETPQEVFLTDASGAASWQLTVDTTGLLNTTSVPFDEDYPTYIQFVTPSAGAWQLQISASELLQTYGPIPGEPRAPEMMLRWSDDGGHTWSNEYRVGVGKSGEYATRVMWRRLGRSRNRIYEISVSDPAPWRIIEGYVEATVG